MELRTAVKDGNIEEVEKLIKEGADVSKAMPDHIIPDEDVEVNLLKLCEKLLFFLKRLIFNHYLSVKFIVHGLASSSLGSSHGPH